MSHLAGLGIASFVMSVFGVIVTFLQEIIAFVTKSAKEKKATKRKVTMAISLVKTKIRGVLPQLLKQEMQALIEQISNGFEEALEQKNRDTKDPRIKRGEYTGHRGKIAVLDKT